MSVNAPSNNKGAQVVAMPEPKLTAFLRRLTTNRTARRNFRKNPLGMMTAAGLSKAQQKLLRSRHLGHLAQAIHAEQPEETKPIVCVIIIDVMPGFWNMEDQKKLSAANSRSRRATALSRKAKKTVTARRRQAGEATR